MSNSYLKLWLEVKNGKLINKMNLYTMQKMRLRIKTAGNLFRQPQMEDKVMEFVKSLIGLARSTVARLKDN